MARNLYQYRVYAQQARTERSFRKARRAFEHCERLCAADQDERVVIYARNVGGAGDREWEQITGATLRQWAMSEE